MNKKQLAAQVFRSVIGLLVILLVATPASAQDCRFEREGYSDIQRMRRCVEEHVVWSPTLLRNASSQVSNPAVVQVLVEAGAELNALNDRRQRPLHRGAAIRNPAVAFPLLDPREESNGGWTPLHSTANRGVVSELVKAGVPDNLTLPQTAALEGDSAAVSLLLAGAADPNTDAYGGSSMHYAVPPAGPGVVSALLAAGADPNPRSVGNGTVPQLASAQAPLAAVSELLRADADPSAIDGEVEGARTPFHYAAQPNRDPSLVLALLEQVDMVGALRIFIAICVVVLIGTALQSFRTRRRQGSIAYLAIVATAFTGAGAIAVAYLATLDNPPESTNKSALLPPTAFLADTVLPKATAARRCKPTWLVDFIIARGDTTVSRVASDTTQFNLCSTESISATALPQQDATSDSVLTLIAGVPLQDSFAVGVRSRSFEFGGDAGQPVVVTMSSSEFDPTLRLLGPGIADAFFDDDGAGDFNAEICAKLPDAGRYRVEAGAWPGHDGGRYSLLMRHDDGEGECNVFAMTPSQQTNALLTLLSDADTIDVGDAVTGAFDTNSLTERASGRPIAAWYIVGRYPDTVAIDVISNEFDPFVYVVTEDRDSVLRADDYDLSRGICNARLRVGIPPAGGVGVFPSAFRTEGEGDYTLSVSHITESERLPVGGCGDFEAADRSNVVGIGVEEHGRLGEGDDIVDGAFVTRWEYRGPQDGRIAFEALSSDFSVRLYLRSADLSTDIFAEAQESGGAARIEHPLSWGENYTVVVSAKEGLVEGGYRLWALALPNGAEPR